MRYTGGRAGPGPARGAYYTASGSAMPAQRRVGFDVGDSSSEEDGENPNEPPDDGIPPQGSTAPRRGAGGARGRRRGPWGGSQTVAAKGSKPSDPREVLPDQDPRPLLHPLRRWGQQVPAASQWPLGSIPGSQGYMIVWAQTHPGAIIHLCYTIAITLSKI